MMILLRRLTAAVTFLVGFFFLATFQGWGMAVIRLIGHERALGEHAVRHMGDGQVLVTNPLAMFLWSAPFLVLGVALMILGIAVWRHAGRTTKGATQDPAGDD